MPKPAQSIAIVLHELMTNAVKYGSLSVSSGRLRVDWSHNKAELVIRWSESGGPPVKAPTRQGFGTRLLDPVVRTELGSRFKFDWNPNGLLFEMVIPHELLATHEG